jgi:hypothetical protein
VGLLIYHLFFTVIQSEAKNLGDTHVNAFEIHLPFGRLNDIWDELVTPVTLVTPFL